ncbi:MAG: amidohydrolase, partial [Kiloniellaceae bacterium]|nr:amidohydrolase [Kiloniellaceae bacterium]
MPDVLYAGGHLTTLYAGRPRAEALLVRGARIAAVGSLAECRAAAGPATAEVDLGGHWVVPGLSDCHVHLASYAFGKHQLDLCGVTDL